MRQIALHLCAALLMPFLAGCASESEQRPAPDPKVAAAKAELQAETQRMVEFKLQPAEQAVRVGETMSFTLQVKNKSAQPINGIQFYADGSPMLYLYDRKVDPAGQVEDGFLYSTVKSDVTIAPNQTTTFIVTGKLSDLIKIQPEGHVVTVTPTITLDGKTIVGAGLEKIKVYVLPAK